MIRIPALASGLYFLSGSAALTVGLFGLSGYPAPGPRIHRLRAVVNPKVHQARVVPRRLPVVPRGQPALATSGGGPGRKRRGLQVFACSDAFAFALLGCTVQTVDTAAMGPATRGGWELYSQRWRSKENDAVQQRHPG